MESVTPMSIRLSQLIGGARLGISGPAPAFDPSITSLTDDSRAVTLGTCFVAVRGTNCDGHHFLDAAVNAGAAAVVVESVASVPSKVVAIRVPDTRVAVAKLAASFYRLNDPSMQPLRLIGVTGTNGKTTVVWLLRSILQAAGNPTALFGTIECDLISERLTSEMTTPGPLELSRRLSAARGAGATHAVLEVSSHALDQHRCDGLSFAAGVFTNLTGDHLDYHKSMEAYYLAKRRLFDSLDAGAFAVVNADDPMGTLMASASSARPLTYALDAPQVDVSVRIESMDSRGTRIVILLPDGKLLVRSALLGRHNVSNVLAAATTSWALGIAPEFIRKGLEAVQGVPGRLQRAEPDGCPFLVLVDYAHTDDALRNVLSAVRPFTRGRLICVFGCGGDRDRTKRPRMASVVEELADLAFVTSDNPRTESPQAIVEEILTGFGRRHGCRVEVEVDRRRAIEAAIGQCEPGDTVLIAGKGHENYQLVGGEALSFDDVEVARECLSAQAVA